MSNPFVGEIRMFGGNFAPSGWAFCSGQLLSIAENDVLFALIGTTYGGDGVNTFGLPDLRGRIPLHQGTGPGLSTYVIGQLAGVENVTLLSNQMPIHTHTAAASSASTGVSDPTNTFWASNPAVKQYAPSTATLTSMAATSVSAVGANQPHDNMPPFLAISFIISLFGIFPTRN
jgi:microcystin-dependent protein